MFGWKNSKIIDGICRIITNNANWKLLDVLHFGLLKMCTKHDRRNNRISSLSILILRTLSTLCKTLNNNKNKKRIDYLRSFSCQFDSKRWCSTDHRHRNLWINWPGQNTRNNTDALTSDAENGFIDYWEHIYAENKKIKQTKKKKLCNLENFLVV